MKTMKFLVTLAVIGLFLFSAVGSDDSSKSSSESTEVVSNSSWDGSVWQVEKYLEKNLKDPDSYEGIEWSPVVKQDDGTFLVRHKYRAKNSFGGYVVEEQYFMLDASGNVIGSY